MQKNLLRDIYLSMARTDFAMLSNGLKDGKMGWSLFLALYSEKNGNSHVRHLSSVLMSEALENVRNMEVNLLEGTGGVIWALGYLKAKDMIEMDENLKKVYGYVMTDRMVRSSACATHDLEDGFLTSGLYSLLSYNPAETAAHYMNVENLIYLVDECERRMTVPAKGLHAPKQMPVSMLTSILYFLKKIGEWNIYPFQIERLLGLVPELYKEISGHSSMDDYVYHTLMDDGFAELEISKDILEAAKQLGTLGFYSLIYDCNSIFSKAYNQWIEADKGNEKRLRKYIKDGQVEAGVLSGFGFGLLNVNP